MQANRAQAAIIAAMARRFPDTGMGDVFRGAAGRLPLQARTGLDGRERRRRAAREHSHRAAEARRAPATAGRRARFARWRS